jgi:hypothetical protein
MALTQAQHGALLALLSNDELVAALQAVLCEEEDEWRSRMVAESETDDPKFLRVLRWGAKSATYASLLEVLREYARRAPSP